MIIFSPKRRGGTDVGVDFVCERQKGHEKNYKENAISFVCPGK